MSGKRFAFLITISSIAAIQGSFAEASDQLPVAPTAEVVDNKGVNVLSGMPFIRDSGLSIGNLDDGGLYLERTWTGISAMVFGGWNHNFNYNIKSNSYSSVVSTGGKSEFFGPTGQPIKPGSTLDYINGDSIYTDRDGTVVTFSTIWLPSGTGTGPLATSLVKPNGERWTFVYGTWSSPNSGNQAFLKSIQSNFGYQIKFHYSPSSSVINSAVAINDAVEYCDPAAASCAGLVNAWPTVNYSRTTIAANSNYTETVVDSVGNQKKYVIATRSDTIGRPLPVYISSQTEGSSGPPNVNYAYTVVSTPIGPNAQVFEVIKSVSDASGVWSYLYDLTSDFRITRKSPASLFLMAIILPMTMTASTG